MLSFLSIIIHIRGQQSTLCTISWMMILLNISNTQYLSGPERFKLKFISIEPVVDHCYMKMFGKLAENIDGIRA